MDGAKLIERIRLKNILSFGEEGQEITLEPLNVLIGPNGSGKSNLIEVLGLLHAAPTDLAAAIRAGGGASEWMWKGEEVSVFPTAEFGVTAQDSMEFDNNSVSHHLEFTDYGQHHFSILGESLEGASTGTDASELVSYYRQSGEQVSISAYVSGPGLTKGIREQFNRDLSEDGRIDHRQSVLSQIKDAIQYPELTAFGKRVGNIMFYRGLTTGRFAAARLPQRADLPDDYLLEDASNLGLVLNFLEVRGQKRRIIELLQKFYEPTEDFTIRVQGGTVQFYLHERGLTQPISAMRLSDGTLHFLYLLAILLHPTPPPLICIEEPEIGLHPDIIPTLAELLVEASQRTQLMVTTHSDALVSALSEMPEAIIVCERDQRGTQLRRLEPGRLKEWLERYTLGDLWHMGEIGGTRW